MISTLLALLGGLFFAIPPLVDQIGRWRVRERQVDAAAAKKSNWPQLSKLLDRSADYHERERNKFSWFLVCCCVLGLLSLVASVLVLIGGL